MSPNQRVASRYLEARSKRKLKKEKKKEEKKEKSSLYDMLDSKFGGWSGCFKPTGNIVKYTTVKGWTYLSKKDRTDALNKARYDFAMDLFEGFNKEIMKEVADQVDEMRGKPNFGLPEDMFSEKNGKLNASVGEVSKEDLEDLAKSLSKSFNTKGFDRGMGAQLFDTFVKDEPLRNIKMVHDLFGLRKNKILKKEQDENKEMRSTSRAYSLNWAMTTFLPMALQGTSYAGSATSVNALASAGATKILAGLGVQGLSVSAVPFVAATAVGSVFYKKVLHKAVQAKRSKKESNFDALAHDIYVGYQTPEGVEKEYKGKIDKVLSDDSLSPEKAKEAMLNIHSDFQEKVRPSIDKGISQLGYEEGYKKMDEGGRSWGKALKLAEEKGEDVPVFARLSMFKEAMEMRDYIAKDFEENYESYFEEMRGILKGDEPVSPEVISYLKGNTSKEELDKSLMKSDKKANSHSEREIEMDQRQLKRQVVRQVMQRRASQSSYEGQIRTAAMYYQAGSTDELKAMLLKYVVNPIDKFRRHLDLFTMPIDDLMDDVIEAVAPDYAEALMESEVDSDFEEFKEGATLRNFEKAQSRGGYFPDLNPPEGKTPEFYEGYQWGDSNRLPVPNKVKKRLIQEAAQEHDKKVVERALREALGVINPIEIIKHAFHIIKKYGWDADADKQWYVKWPLRFFKVVVMAIAVAIVEAIEHYVLPATMVKLTGNPAWWGLASVPVLEIIMPIVVAYFKGAKKDVVDEPGHLDWYEETYGEIEDSLEDENVFGKKASYAY